MNKLTRRDALRFGAGAVVSSVAVPLAFSQLDTPFATGDATAATGDICYMRAVDMSAAIRAKKLSSREVMQAHLKQIKRVNEKVNAIVTLVPEDQLMAKAAAADEAWANGKWLGPLHGLPVGVKDLHETEGIRTTFGSPLHKDHIPDFDCRLVQREKAAGAIVIGKTKCARIRLGLADIQQSFWADAQSIRSE